MEQSKERVLVVEPVHPLALREAERYLATGGEVVIVTTAAQARAVNGTFDRGVFAFDLPDGSGVLLAAGMLLESRVAKVSFFHPDEERAARELPSSVHAALGEHDQEEQLRRVA